MRNRSKTIASLRRLAERPGTPEEGETARRLLEKMTGRKRSTWIPRPFDPQMFPTGTTVYYGYWCYRNERGVVRTKPPKVIQGRWWMLIKFERLKVPRWVPVTSEVGCHLSLTPWSEHDLEILEWRDPEAKSMEERFQEFMEERGIEWPKAKKHGQTTDTI